MFLLDYPLDIVFSEGGNDTTVANLSYYKQTQPRINKVLLKRNIFTLFSPTESNVLVNFHS